MAIGPMFSDEGLKDAATAQRAERFASRTVDLTKTYPEPFAYRTPTPTFPNNGPTGVAEAARTRALATTGERFRDAELHDQPFDAFAFSTPARSRAPNFDRHTGVAY